MTLEKQFLDTQQVADYLGVHEKQVYTLIHDRSLPATKITGKWIFPLHLVDRWIESSVINMPETGPLLKEARGLLLIAGSDDPLLLRLITIFRRRTRDVLVLQSRAGSRDGLMALKKGMVHLACVHLPDPDGGYTTGHIREFLGEDIAVISFAERTQGILIGPGNPLDIQDLSEAFTRNIRWAVREVGTGTRALMDLEIDRQAIDPGQTLSRSVQVQSHLDTALAILTDKADAGLGVEAAARLSGCDFIPVRKERFDLIVKREKFFLPQVQGLLELLEDGEFEETAALLNGYDLTESGKIRV